MLRQTLCACRYRTAWRELLHPLPIRTRHQQWLKRDTVEINEAILRQPYYTIKGYDTPSHVDRGTLFCCPAIAGEEVNRTGKENSTQSSSYAVKAQLQAARHATSPERLQELRDQLQFSGSVGPMPAMMSGITQKTFQEDFGERLRPRYPNSWDTVPPHQPSRGM